LDFSDEAQAARHAYAPVEFKSPVIVAAVAAAATSNAFGAATGQLYLALDAIRARFTTATNDSCSVHVHVDTIRTATDKDGKQQRRRQRKGFDVATLRALAALVTALEAPLSTLHEPPRQRQCRYYRPPSEVPALAILPTPRARTALLWRMRCASDLYNAFNDGRGRSWAHNLSNPADVADDNDDDADNQRSSREE
jgi:hypothetical protein